MKTIPSHIKSWANAILAVSALCILPVSALKADDTYVPLTLDFNDLGPSPVGTHMSATYGGFSWLTSDYHYMTLALTPGDDFLALSGNATAFFVGGGQDFYFDGADFWSRRGLDANGRFFFILHHDGVMVYDGREDNDGREDFTATHQLFTANYTGLVDSVAMAFVQGGDDWDHLAMDNVQVRVLESVPEPGSAMLIGAAALLLGLSRNRR